MRRLIEPVRRGWVLAWLTIVLALSLWALWSAQNADDHADQLDLARSFQRCEQQASISRQTNRDATDQLAELFHSAARFRAIEHAVDDHDAQETLRLSIRQTDRALHRMLSQIPAADRGRVLKQLAVADPVIPPVAFVAVPDCDASYPGGARASAQHPDALKTR